MPRRVRLRTTSPPNSTPTRERHTGELLPKNSTDYSQTVRTRCSDRLNPSSCFGRSLTLLESTELSVAETTISFAGCRARR